MAMIKDGLLRTLTLVYLLLCLLLLGGAWYLYDFTRSNDQAAAEGEMHATLRVTAKTISGVIARNQSVLNAFFSARSAQLQRLAKHPDEQELTSLANRLREIVPSMFAMNLMNPDGEFAIPNFDGKVDEICRADTRLALLHAKYLHRLHPNNLGLHYDTFYPFMEDGRQYMVMVSIRILEIRQILALANANIVHVYIRSPLNEGQSVWVGPKGVLDDAQRARIEKVSLKESLPLTDSEMQVVALVDPAYRDRMSRKRLTSILPIGLMAFVTITVMWLILMRGAMVQVRQKRELQRLHAELEARNIELADQARTDVLTRLNNRGYFDERLKEAWFQAARRKTSLSLILFDIDHFKRWNDTYGHAVGDEVLKMVAEVLRTQIRRSGDLTARFGGEEFVALLPDTDVDAACKLAESLRTAVEAMEMPAPITGRVTISLGVVATVPDPSHEPASLVGQADILLYRAKSLGRNRSICAYDSSMAGAADKPAG